MLSLKTWETETSTVAGSPITFKVKRLGFRESKPFNVVFGRLRLEEPIRAQRDLERASQALTAAGLAIVTAAVSAAGLTPVAHADTDEALKANVELLKAAGIPIPDVPADQERELTKDLQHYARKVAEANEVLFTSIDDEWAAECFARFVDDVSGLEVDGEAVTTGEALFAVASPALVISVLRSIRRFSHLGEAEKNGSSSPLPSAPGAEVKAGSIAEPAGSVDSTWPGIVTAIPTVETSSSEQVTPEAVPV